MSNTKIDLPDKAGKIHTIIVRQHEEQYIVHSLSCVDLTGHGGTQEQALQSLMAAINHNSPYAFEAGSNEKQQALIEWIQANLQPGRKEYSSYHLKHLAENGIGQYVGNGEMKGAMLKAGYEPHKDTIDHINWNFCLKKLAISYP